MKFYCPCGEILGVYEDEGLNVFIFEHVLHPSKERLYWA